MVDLSIIIVTWNCRKYLREFFESFVHLLDNSNVQVIVVDNASNDGTSELISNEFPSITLVHSGGNLGFARANNIGLAMATGELVCLVNPDVQLFPNCFERMMELMRQDPSIGLLGPQMFGSDRKVHRSTMRFPTVWNYLCNAFALDTMFPRSKVFRSFLTNEFRHDQTKEVEVLNGWFWMTRRSALEVVGVLDEAFFMYGEDIDWCMRFHLAGWKRIFFADAAGIHYGGGSSSNAPIKFYVEQQRAILQYFRKYHNVFEQMGFLASMWLYHVVRILGHGVAYLSADSNREDVGGKVRRSTACIRWLLGLTPTVAGKN